MSWSKVNADLFRRLDGALVERKMSGAWGWVAPDGERVPGVRGKSTAAEAMAHVDHTWPLDESGDPGGVGYVLPPRDEPSSERRQFRTFVGNAADRLWPPRRQLTEAQQAYVLEPRGGPPTSRVRRWAEERYEAPVSSTSAALESALQRMSPSSFARALSPPSTPRPTAHPPPHIEALVQRELAQTPRPTPVATIPPRSQVPRESLPSAKSAPITAQSPVFSGPPTTRRWGVTPELLHDAAPSTRPGPPPRQRALMRDDDAAPSTRPGPPPRQRTLVREDTPKPTFAGSVKACGDAAVLAALERHPGNKTAAARELGLTRNGLYHRLHAMGWSGPAESRAVRAQAGASGARARWNPDAAR